MSFYSFLRTSFCIRAASCLVFLRAALLFDCVPYLNPDKKWSETLARGVFTSG